MAQDTSAALRILFSADSSQLDQALNTLTDKLDRVGKKLQKTGKTLSRNVTAPLTAIAGIATKTAVDFEFAMAKVQAVSGFTADEMQRLTNSAKDFGAKTAFSASEVADLQKELAKLGFRSGEIINLTDGVLSLAQAFDLELGDAAEKVALTLNRFGLEASESGRVADVMAKSFGSSALDAEKFEEAMKTVGPVAKSLGFELEEVTGILGVLANNGISGSIAGTKLTRVLSVMAKEGIDVQDGFAQLLTETTSVKDAFDRFGARGAGIVPILQENAEEVGRLSEEFRNAAGTASQARKVMDDTAQGALNRMKSALEAAAIELGQALLPAFLRLVQFVTDLAIKFTELDPVTQNFIITIGALAAATGPALIAVGQMSLGLKALMPVLAAVRMRAVAMYAALGGPGLAAVGLAIGTIYVFNKALNKNRERLDEVTAAQNRAAKAARGHISALEEEAGKLSDEDLQKRIDELKAEKEAIGGTVSILDDRIANLARSAEIDAVALQNSKTYQETLADGTTVTRRASDEDKRRGEVVAELSALQAELATRQEADRKATEAATAARNAQAQADREAAEAARLLAQQQSLKAAEETGKELGLDPDELNVTGLLDALGSDLVEQTVFAIQSPFLAMEENIKSAEETVNESVDAMSAKTARLATIGAAVGQAFGAGMAQLITGSKSAKAAIKDMVGSIVSGALRASQANIIAAMTNAGIASGPAAPFVIPALVASGIALVEGLFAAIPAMATGGITTGPTLALLGDNPSGREAVIPFERMGQFMDMAGASGSTTVTGRLQGMDLLLSNERASLARNRTT